MNPDKPFAASKDWEDVFLPLFEERQRFSIWVRGPLWGSIFGFAAVLLFLQVRGLPAEVSRIVWSLWAVTSVIDGLIAASGMLTRVRKEGIEVMGTPLTFLRRRIGWEEIERIYARTYSPLLEYGGWGIRFGRSGTAYNIRGHQGIQLELKNGKKLLLGTQQPQEFLEAVRAAAPEKI